MLCMPSGGGVKKEPTRPEGASERVLQSRCLSIVPAQGALVGHELQELSIPSARAG